MKKRIEPLSLEGIQTYPLQSRKSLVRVEDFARPLPAALPFRNLFLLCRTFWPPGISGTSRPASRQPIAGESPFFSDGCPSHQGRVKPLIIHLLESGILQGVAMNGAGIIHDFEIACVGEPRRMWPRKSDPVLSAWRRRPAKAQRGDSERMGTGWASGMPSAL